MTEIDLESLRASLAKHGATAKVIAYRGDDLLRTIPVPVGRKRNAAVLAVAAKLDWDRVELLDKSGGLLDVVEAEHEATVQDDGVELSGRDAQLLAILVRAQQMVLANRERETQIALQACTQSVKMLTDAVGALANVQSMTLDAQAQAFKMAGSVAQADGNELESTKLLAQLAPMIMAKLLAPGPAPAPATPSNGVKS